MTSSLLLTGIGLRAQHYAEFLEKKPGVAWVEVHSENFYGEGGYALHTLEQVRRDYPVSLHGVNLSLGSADDLNWQHVKKLKELTTRVEPCLISDHLAWTSINGHYLHDLLPLPYTEEALQHIVTRIQQIQDYLQRQLLIENISSYLTYAENDMQEWEFLREIAQRAGCGILLDINNIYVSANNLDFDPQTYLAAIPANLVQEMHLAGFTEATIDDRRVLIDSHDRPVAPAVWDLYREAVQLMGRKPTIIEWDSNMPTLDALYLEAFRAEKMMRESYVTAKLTG